MRRMGFKGTFSHASHTFSGAFLTRAPTTEPRSKALLRELCLLGLRVSPACSAAVQGLWRAPEPFPAQ